MPKSSENKDYESKSIQLKLDETGKLSAVIAQFGVVDHDNDIVEPTAFKNGQEVAIVWSHDWDRPVGKGLIDVTATEAIFNGSFFMETVDGQESYKTVKAMGSLQEWSWGFHTTKSSWEQQGEQMIRHLVETEVYEVSPVLKGAGIGTRTLLLKGMHSLDSQIHSVVEATDSLGERLRSVKGMRQEEGRTISEDRKNQIKELATELRKAADSLEESVEDIPELEAVDIQKEYNKFLHSQALQNGVGKGNSNGN